MPDYKKYDNWKGLRIRTCRHKWRKIFWFWNFYTGDTASFYLDIKRIENSAPDLGTLHVSEKLPEQNKVTPLLTFKSFKGKDKLKIKINTSELTRQGELICKLTYPDINANGANL